MLGLHLGSVSSWRPPSATPEGLRSWLRERCVPSGEKTPDCAVHNLPAQLGLPYDMSGVSQKDLKDLVDAANLRDPSRLR